MRGVWCTMLDEVAVVHPSETNASGHAERRGVNAVQRGEPCGVEGGPYEAERERVTAE